MIWFGWHIGFKRYKNFILWFKNHKEYKLWHIWTWVAEIMISIFESRIKIYFVVYVQNPNQPSCVHLTKKLQHSRDNTHQFERENNDQNKIYIHIYRFMSAFYQVNLILVHSSKDLFDSCLILLLLLFFFFSLFQWNIKHESE